MLTSLRRLTVTVTGGRRDDVSSHCRRSVSSREHAIDGGFSLSCPLCGTRVAGNRVMLNKHIRSQHSPLITSQLTLDPETTYSAIFGRPPKRTNVKELRFGEGLAVTRKGPWRGFWYDFAESRGGGPIEAILKAASSEMTYAEAAVKAAALAGINYQSEEAGSRRGDIWAREKELISEIAQHTERKLQEESRAKSLRVETARNIWEAGVPLKDTLGEAYLVDHRGIPSDVLSRLSLQFLEPGAVYVEFDVMGMKQKKVNNGPGLLVPVEDHQGNLCGVQRIYVDPKTGGKPANGTAKHKFSLGSVAGNGGVVQRGSGGGDVIVAEGPETCVSLAAVSPPDAWVVAALSIGNFANLAKYITSKMPESRVIFAGDNDSADRRVQEMFFRNCNAAAAEIRSTWRPVKVVTVRPDTDGADWNDVLVAEGREALATQFWGKVNRMRCDEEIL